MKAIVLTEAKKLDISSDFPIPQPGNEETLVKIKAAALNHRDVWIMNGQYAGIKYPIIPGSDGAGVVNGQEVIINPSKNWGDHEKHQSPSYQILGLPQNGTFAEYILINKDRLHPKPAHLNWEEAAALPLAGLTAYRALFSRGQLQKGEKVLVSGIGGGVALFALQFALAAGAEVWVSSSSKEKIEKAIKLGATGGANYNDDHFAKNLIKVAGGFDLIIDGAAGSGFADFLKICNPGARILNYGGTRGKITNMIPQILFWKQISIMGTTMGSDRDFSDMLNFVKKHQIKPIIDSVFPLRKGKEAFEHMDAGKQFGKIVLSMEE